ncbi:MAG: hypothetical protein J6Q94_03540 [Clostridia bacterium]|nr:hypothetical protein [Clostridia bacterium]
MKGKKVFRLNKRLYIIFILISVLIVSAVIAIVSSSGNGRISLFYSPGKNAAIVLTNGSDTGNTVTGKSISCIRYNSDSTSCSVLMSDGAAYTLYSVNAKKVEKITDNCTSNVVHSYNGKNSVYITSDGNLYSGKNMIEESVESFAVSSDCSVILFLKNDGNNKKLYLYKGGKSTFINEGYTPLAVSDDGKNLYILSGDNSLFILNPDGTMKSKLCSDVISNTVWFSDDLRCVVFSDGEYTYISEDGGNRVRLAPGNVAPVFTESEVIRLNSTGTAFICSDDDLAELFYCGFNEDGTNALFYIGDDYSRTDITNSAKKYIITDDDRLTFLDSAGNVYRYDGAVSEQIASNATDFEATSKNRYVYYITGSNELYSVKRSNTQLVASDAEKIYMTASDILLVIAENKNLFSISGTKRSDIIDENVSFCVREGDIIYYTADYSIKDGTYSLYCSEDGKKFRSVAENIIKTIG